MNSITKNVISWLLVFTAIGLLLSTMNFPFNKKIAEIDTATLVSKVNAGEVEGIKVEGDKLHITLKDKTLAESLKESGQPLSELFDNYKVPTDKLMGVKIEVQGRSSSSWLLSLLPSFLTLLLLGALIYIMFRQVSGMNNKAMSFGNSGARESPKGGKDRVTFKDVAGVKEAKEELQEVVEFLKHPKKFVAVGAKIPKGVLLMGLPGGGKTLLARAVAGEADVPFFHISGSEFVEMFVGVGAARVRDLFARAKKAAPCIIFIDEIDAVGRTRGAGMGGNHDEREQTLNQILVEMDGFEPNSGVILLAATNRPDVLDAALLRPGRFDRRVILDPPDINDREAIMKIHATGKPLATDVELRRVAERTPGFSGADLMNLLNEAAIKAARANRKTITQEDILTSIEKVLLGPERKSHLLNDREREITAYHEAGHALVAHLLQHADPVHKVSIISRGRAAGYTLKLPLEDTKLNSRKEFYDDLAVMLGGYVSELENFGDMTTGASNDLKQATLLSRRMVMEYGMSETLGPRAFGVFEDEAKYGGLDVAQYGNVSSKIAESIDGEMKRLVDDAQAVAKKTIANNETYMKRIVDLLLKQETIEKEEFESLFKDHPSAPTKGGKKKTT
ncbi:MAG: ATP-dependent zinc metalloprotease FtsH [bacterium]